MRISYALLFFDTIDLGLFASPSMYMPGMEFRVRPFSFCMAHFPIVHGEGVIGGGDGCPQEEAVSCLPTQGEDPCISPWSMFIPFPWDYEKNAHPSSLWQKQTCISRASSQRRSLPSLKRCKDLLICPSNLSDGSCLPCCGGCVQSFVSYAFCCSLCSFLLHFAWIIFGVRNQISRVDGPVSGLVCKV